MKQVRRITKIEEKLMHFIISNKNKNDVVKCCRTNLYTHNISYLKR